MTSPLHARVGTSLRARIDGRDLQPGDLLPSEAALSEEYEVSRSVVRQALASLEADGLVLKSQGRGTVVREPREVHRDVRRSGLRWQTGVGGAVTTAVLAWEVTDKPGHLDVMPGEQALRVERLRSVEGSPVSVIRTWLPVALAEVLTADALTDDSLHRLLGVRLGRPVAGGRSQVRAVAATEEHAVLLGVDAGTPLLLLEGTSHDATGEVLEAFSTWHRADLVAFDLDTTPASGAAGPDGTQQRLAELTAEVAAMSARLDDLR